MPSTNKENCFIKGSQWLVVLLRLETLNQWLSHETDKQDGRSFGVTQHLEVQICDPKFRNRSGLNNATVDPKSLVFNAALF